MRAGDAWIEKLAMFISRSCDLFRWSAVFRMSPSSSTSTGSQIATWRRSLIWTRHDFNYDNPSPSLPLFALPFPSSSIVSLSLPLPGEPLPHYQLRGLGERCKLTQRGPWRSPGRKRIFGHFCGSDTYLVAAISPLCYAAQMTKFTHNIC